MINLSERAITLLKDDAIRAAQAAGSVLLKHFRKKLSISEKPGAGLVTNADLEAEAKAVNILRRSRPDFGFLTEEAPPKTSSGLGRWVIDPLDGTTNFVHGFPMFCVSIAAEWNGQVVVGVIHHPILNETYVAVQGRGASLNGRKIKVSPTSRLEDSLLTTGFTYRKSEFLRHEIETFEKLSKKVRAIRRPGSAALDLVYTACGVFDAFWERSLSPWDVAAGSLIVQEAGGKVTQFDGSPFRIEGAEVLASNARIHSSLIKEISFLSRSQI